MKQFQNCRVALGIAVMLSAALAQAQIPMLTADTQINSAATTTNYGSSTSLTVNSTNSALLLFNLPDLLPNGTTAAQVLKARLIIYTETVTTGGDVNLYQVTSSWSEGSVTYATKPTVASALAATTAVGVARNFHEFTVTSLVQDWNHQSLQQLRRRTQGQRQHQPHPRQQRKHHHQPSGGLGDCLVRPDRASWANRRDWPTGPNRT